MPTAFILPTRELVYELSPLDNFFYFVDGGIRKLVAEAVFEACGLRSTYALHQTKTLREYVLYSYEATISSMDFEISEYNDTVGKIDFLIEAIERDVRATLNSVFVRNRLDLKDRRHMWLCDDLMVIGDVRRGVF